MGVHKDAVELTDRWVYCFHPFIKLYTDNRAEDIGSIISKKIVKVCGSYLFIYLSIYCLLCLTLPLPIYFSKTFKWYYVLYIMKSTVFAFLHWGTLWRNRWTISSQIASSLLRDSAALERPFYSQSCDLVGRCLSGCFYSVLSSLSQIYWNMLLAQVLEELLF